MCTTVCYQSMRLESQVDRWYIQFGVTTVDFFRPHPLCRYTDLTHGQGRHNVSWRPGYTVFAAPPTTFFGKILLFWKKKSSCRPTETKIYIILFYFSEIKKSSALLAPPPHVQRPGYQPNPPPHRDATAHGH